MNPKLITGLILEKQNKIIRKLMRIYIHLLITTFFWISCTEDIEHIKPTVTSMTESVYASVNVMPQDVYFAYAAAPGILEKVYIEEGDTIFENQRLALIQSDDSKINIDNAALGLEIAKEKFTGESNILKSINQEIEALIKQLELDSTNYFRQNQLWNQNIGSKSDLDNKKLKYELTQNNLTLKRKQYDQTRLDLENSYKKSQNDLKRARSNLIDFEIRSKINGRIYKLYKEEGELISLQEPFAQIGMSGEFILDIIIDEVDITRVKTGQLALVALDAYEDQVFEAEITKIYPLKDNRTQTFQVEGKFISSPSVLYAGLSGEVNIVLSTKEDVLTIPLNYLIEGKRVKTKDSEIEVEVGMKDLNRVEIISGIDSSTILLKPQ
ncbi:MAG: efflux RND transporter periplasmic adaptor subunit [Bacteroidia bacterium]|nr:efflux RND transporter periplasmic adaptor subunit [Bacteroidia bacterium]